MSESESSEDSFALCYSSDDESNSECEELADVRTWCRLNPEIPQPAPPAFPFIGNPGFKISVSNLTDPVDYFKLFFLMKI